MKKFTFYLFALCCFAFSWQTYAQSIINITTSGGDYPGEKWVSITDAPDGGGTQFWGQGDGTQCNGSGLINENISLPPGTYYVNCYDQYDDGWDGTLITITSYGNVIGDNGGVSPDDGEDTDASTSCEGTPEELEASFMIVVPVAPCVTAEIASSTVVDDCAAGTFMVNIDFTAVGDATGVSDGTTNYPITGTTAMAGPFANGTTQNLSVVHSDSACDFSLGDFITSCTLPGEVCENSIIIGALPYSTTDNTSNYGDDYGSADEPCSTSGYLTGDDVVYSFTPATDMSVNMTTSGTGSWTGLFIYEQCPFVTCVDSDTQSSGNPSIPEVSLIGGTTYYIVISTYPSPQSTAYTLDITENTCTASTSTVTVVNDCDVSGGFYVDVEVTDMGSATDLTVSDDQGNPSQALTASGTLQFGPYVNGVDVVITLNDDNDDDSCTVVKAAVTQTICPPSNDDCSNATVLTVDPDYSCASSVSGTTIGATQSLAGCVGTANDDVWYSFVATSTDHRITITNTGGATDIVTQVFDACGGASLVCQDTPNSPINLSGLTPANTYFFRIYTYSSSASIRTSFDVCVGTAPSCLQPSSGSASAITENSADLGWVEAGTATTWNVEWGVTDFTLGTGTLISGTTTNPQPLSGLTALTTYDYYVQADCGGGDLSAWSGPYTFTTSGPIPTNISCATAEAIACGDSITGTTEGSTGTQEDSGCSIGNNGVWYTFTGDGGDLIVTVDADFDHELAITSGTCGALVNIGCDDQSTGQESYTIVDSVDGETYYVYIAHYSNGSTTTGTYKIMLECETMTTDEFDSPNAFTYYPNPVSNVLNVKAQNNISNVAVYNMLGQEVLRTAPNTVASEVDMSNLQTGAYFVKVTIGNATKTIRVIKN